MAFARLAYIAGLRKSWECGFYSDRRNVLLPKPDRGNKSWLGKAFVNVHLDRGKCFPPIRNRNASQSLTNKMRPNIPIWATNIVDIIVVIHQPWPFRIHISS